MKKSVLKSIYSVGLLLLPITATLAAPTTSSSDTLTLQVIKDLLPHYAIGKTYPYSFQIKNNTSKTITDIQLNITALPLEAASNFEKITLNTCSSVLQPGKACTIEATVTPTLSNRTYQATLQAHYVVQQEAIINNSTIGMRPVITLEGGIGIARVGESETLPPIQQTTYAYTANGSYQTAPLVGAFAGVEIPLVAYPKWRFQLGLAYDYLTSMKASGINTVTTMDTHESSTYNYNYSIRSQYLLTEAKVFYTFADRWHPYVLAGIGSSFNSAYGYQTSLVSAGPATASYNNRTTTNFAYEAGLGLALDVTDHLRVGVGYQFASLGKAQLGASQVPGQDYATSTAMAPSQSQFYVNEIVGHISYIF